jgi:hypothetical protein
LSPNSADACLATRPGDATSIINTSDEPHARAVPVPAGRMHRASGSFLTGAGLLGRVASGAATAAAAWSLDVASEGPSGGAGSGRG